MLNSTTLDWVGFRSKEPLDSVQNTVRKCFMGSRSTEILDIGRGWNGYERSFVINFQGKRVGMIASGGANMRDWTQVNLTGSAIPHIAGNAAETLTESITRLRGQLKRVDLALTTQDGSVSLKTVRDAYASGGFTSGGRRPKIREQGPGQHGHSADGTTIYIGERDQPKFARCYEKGYELAKECNRSIKAHTGLSCGDIVSIDGVPVKDIFRCEVEYKPDPITCPIDLLINSDAYFAGAYPYFSTLVQAKPELFCLTPLRTAQLLMDEALAQVRHQYGNTLFTALMTHYGDMTAVWDKIVGDRHCAALVERGVLVGLEYD